MTDRAGTPALESDLVDLDDLLRAYEGVAAADQPVVFGTSGHRGSSLDGAFTDTHIAAITQAIVEYRSAQGVEGPVFVGADTHALSAPAQVTCLEVLAANGVTALVDADAGWVPTPAVSRAIIRHNRALEHGTGAISGRRRDASAERRLGAREPRLADGIVITPSHNPPRDGGFKYNPPHGGPADSDATGWIAGRANEIIAGGNRDVKRSRAVTAEPYDFRGEYVTDLASVLDLGAIKASGLRLGADPLGGASVDYWKLIASHYGLPLEVTNPAVDPTWRFMTLDWDEKIRMDPSSPSAMASVVARRADFDILTGNDADADRHGIVTPDGGLMNPNHYLAVAIQYLCTHRDGWSAEAAIGKTLVSSTMIDRVVASLGRRLWEVPVGFKWFVPGLIDGSVAFGGEESAGASFLELDGSAWTTDKDGIILALLAAEIRAVTGKSPSVLYSELTEEFGDPAYARVDAAASPAQKARLGKLSGSDIRADKLAGDPIVDRLSSAPGNGAAIGGVKVVTEHAWFAARPSGTEDVYKIYAESFRGPDHLAEVQAEAKLIVDAALGS
ncbi:phosphoglucomutase, alpha-D-glucose phosphate-specific [Pseudolysinimonas sp.]|uniref:phosphoglucomutase, alpha-D-glucose phosphate-specific n=1 Tax=Pseudolysinimonas sp. TaxID=2680009 RepID=UPI00286B8DB3|nr:phosphoglucomutase, alpha-D-glucose phosphate-specific [Pseudolysinimonas sp.]